MARKGAARTGAGPRGDVGAPYAFRELAERQGFGVSLERLKNAWLRDCIGNGRVSQTHPLVHANFNPANNLFIPAMIDDGTRIIRTALFALVCLAASGCATTPRGDMDENDPLEGMNRAVFNFNEALDRAVLKPVADAYVDITPQPVRTSISNFFDNLVYPSVILNDFLQGKVRQGISDTARFVWNSTAGIFGLFDVASRMDLPAHDEDFGQTLGVWGVGEGPYLVLPILGPSSFRDAPGVAVTYAANGLYYIGDSTTQWGLSALNGVDLRARAAGFMRFRDVAALDPYLFTRESYRQYRTYQIYDGNVPRSKLLEELEEDEEDLPEEGAAATPAQ